MSEINENMNEGFQMTMEDPSVITIKLDDTLTLEGAAADAKAVGDALALKADLSDIVGISVNGEDADAQGLVLIDGTDIPLSDADGAPTIAAAVQGALNALEGMTAADIPMSSTEGADTVKAAIEALQTGAAGCVKSVNGETPNASGNVLLNTVPLAQNLTSDTSQASAGAFVLRTTGGSRSVKSGQAQIQEIRGMMNHTGQVQEVLNWDTNDDDFTADIDRDDWVAEVTEGGTYVFQYDGSVWKLDSETVTLSGYGITVTGSPTNGDSITVTYVAEERGTITPATPAKFIATGWNLYNASAGYARVKKYEYKYHIGGDYTGLQFSATLNGTRTDVTVEESGSFDIPSDGYVWPSGASAANTYITLEWTDWTTGNPGTFESYQESEIDLSEIMGEVFPDGLLSVGSVYDEINLTNSQAISRIEKLDYDAETLAAVIAAGRAYDADENYIYAVRTSFTPESITISNQYQANDHGLEMFTGTDVGPYVIILYGQDLKAKLVNDVLTISQQTLTDPQKEQVLDNIGAASAETVGSLIISAAYTKTYTLAAGAGTSFNASALSYTVPSGYKALGIAYAHSGKNAVAISGSYVSGNDITIRIVNTSSQSQSGTMSVRVLFIRK